MQAALNGSSINEMAVSLTISQRTVQTHLSKIYGKLNVRTRLELIALYSAPRTELVEVCDNAAELIAECIGITAEGFLWYAVTH